MSSSHGRQKKLAKHKKKRELAKRKVTQRPQVAVARNAVLQQALDWPHGPAFISADFTREAMDPPRLVSVVVTRKMPGGMFLPVIALVDRTCLGVKNAFVSTPVTEWDLGGFMAELGSVHEGGMVPCELAVAQSVVYNAIDYAGSLGFEPHPDFADSLFGPRPEPLLDTPLARPARPFWVRGPDDDAEEILETLDEAVGEGNYDVAMIQPSS